MQVVSDVVYVNNSISTYVGIHVLYKGPPF